MPDDRPRIHEDSARFESALRDQIVKLKDELKEEIGDIETQMAVIEGDVRGIRADVKEMQVDIKGAHKIDITLARHDERLGSLEEQAERVKRNEDKIKTLVFSNVLAFITALAGPLLLWLLTKNR